MKILVTGGAGFIGSHLCDRLLADGHEVICLDNFISGQRSNVSHLIAGPRFTLVEGDVTEPYDFAVDQIYNLACPASPINYQRDPLATVKTCVLGAIHALELARERRIPLLQASTSEVYGDPQVHPQPESYHGDVNPTGPRACYDEGKRCAETLCFDYHRQHGVLIKVVRIFNTYGPRMAFDDGRVISNFIVAALQGNALRLDGDGVQTRSFCFVDDMVRGLIEAMATPPSFTGPVNLGNPGEFTIRELATVVLQLTGSAAGVTVSPARPDDPRRRQPDITLARRVLDWEPKVPLAEGLRRTIPYFQQALKPGTRTPPYSSP